jgi:hypothetical protein
MNQRERNAFGENRRRAIARRTFLKGIGVTMALPWLESLPALGAEAGSVAASGAGAASAAGAAAATLPKRFAVMFMGCGVNPDHWWANSDGPEMELGKTLEPLESIKSKINVINGLFNKSATGQGIHPAMTGQLLSGVQMQKGAIIHGGVSMDQVLANTIGQETLQPSMVLACEQPMTGYHESNFSNAYSSHISWANAESPMPNEMYPSLAFDALFENRGSARNISVLDRVKDHAQRLSKQVNAADKRKLDEYLYTVRDVEKKIERMRDDKTKAEDHANGRPLLTMKRPENGLPEDLRDVSPGNGGSHIIDPFGNVIAGPAVDEEIVCAEVSLGSIRVAKTMCDVAGHYSRPDIFTLSVDRRTRTRVETLDSLASTDAPDDTVKFAS